MPGHRRKASSSTIATVDSAVGNTLTVYHDETTILKRLEDVPENADSDAWPSFILTNAAVYHKDSKRMANPLLPEKPLIVRGRLEVDDMDTQERKSLINPKTKSVDIKIKASWMYSLDPEPTIWVSGACGWYEISPRPEYEETFNEAGEAATLYFTLLDIHKEHVEKVEAAAALARRKKQRLPPPPDLSVDEILFRYAYEMADGMLREEAEQLCHKWAPFLISHFMKRIDLNWDETAFYKWIIRQHPDVYKKALKVMGGQDQQLKQGSASERAPPSQKPSPVLKPSASFQALDRSTRSSSEISQNRGSRFRKQTQETPDVEMKDVPANPPPSNGTRHGSRKSGVEVRATANSSHSPAPTPVPTPAPTVPATQQTTPMPVSTPTSTVMDTSTPASGALSTVDLFLNALEEILLKLKIAPNKIAKSAIISNLYYSFRIKNYYGSSECLAYYSKELVQRLDPKWHGSGFYTWLTEAAKNPPKELVYTKVEDIPKQLVRRAKKQAANNTASASASASRSKLEVRPKSTPTPKRQESDEESDEDSDEEDDTLPRRANQGGLRMTSATKKRKTSDLLDNDAEEEASGRHGRKPAKFAKYFYNPDEDIVAESDSSDAESSSQEADDDEDDEDMDGPPIPKDAVRVVIHAEKLPTLSPTGPNGTWVCHEEDCSYIVRAPENEAGQAKIHQHFREHELATEKVALTLTEGRRGHMPINHLLEKIQAIGKSSLDEKKQTINGVEVPPPIKRRLLI